MKPSVAIACSGLGHVQRGIEAWAADLARGLRQAGIEASLFGGAPGPGIAAVPCLRRTGPGAIGTSRMLRHLGGWRYGFGSPYEAEQTTFALSLWHRVRQFDILHVQDPAIALWFERAWRRGLSRPGVIYANGTGEGEAVMRRFAHLQLLTEGARDAWLPHRPPRQAVFAIPNFIDTERFSPGDRGLARAGLGLPDGALIVLCCAAIRRFHKRIDHLLEEFAMAAPGLGPNAMLVIAGGREADTDALIAEGTRLLGSRVRFLSDVPRERMPDLYRAADVFTLASLHEMFGIVLLEAMATGLPVLCHDAAGFRGIVGTGGLYRDLSRPGGLAGGLAALVEPAARAALAAAARGQVQARYADSVVVPEIISMYHTVLNEHAHG
jgi:glycosyltransferase involved in cell wall biosynthesis